MLYAIFNSYYHLTVCKKRVFTFSHGISIACYTKHCTMVRHPSVYHVLQLCQKWFKLRWWYLFYSGPSRAEHDDVSVISSCDLL